MRINRSMKLVFALNCILVFACAPEHNISGMVYGTDNYSKAEKLLLNAERAFDIGQFQHAINMAKEAKNLGGNAQKITLILAHSHLELAGIKTLDFFEIPKDDEKKPLDDTIEIVSQQMALKATQPIKNQLFAHLPIYQPIKIEDARKNIDTMKHLNEAIILLCPYITRELLLIEHTTTTDQRHKHETCQITTNWGENPSFLFPWAIAHLVEAEILKEFIIANQENIEERIKLLVKISEKAELIDATENIVQFIKEISPSAKRTQPYLIQIINNYLTVSDSIRVIFDLNPNRSGHFAHLIENSKKQISQHWALRMKLYQSLKTHPLVESAQSISQEEICLFIFGEAKSNQCLKEINKSPL